MNRFLTIILIGIFIFSSSCTMILPIRSLIKNPREVQIVKTHKSRMDKANNKDYILRWLGTPRSTIHLNGNEIWKYAYATGTVEFTFQGSSKNVSYWRTNGIDLTQRTSNDTKRMAKGFKMMGIGLALDLIGVLVITEELFFYGSPNGGF